MVTTRPPMKPVDEAAESRYRLAKFISKLNIVHYEYRKVLGELAKAFEPYPSSREEFEQEAVNGIYVLMCEIQKQFGVSHQELLFLIEEAEEREIEARKRYLHTMPYPEYLKTEHWQEKRKEARERANERCQVCNATTTLNVHHRTYVRRGYEEPEDLIVLCKGCHQLFHDNGKLERES